MPPAALPRARRAGRRDLRQPARRARASGQGYAAKWINQYDGLDNVITHADEITGKKGEALREHLGDVIRNRRLNALVTRPRARRRARPTWPGRPGTGRRCTRSSTAWSSAVLRTRLLEALPSEEEAAIDDSGFDVSMRVLDDRRAGRLAGRARVARRAGSASTRSATGGPAPATSLALAFATEDGRRLRRHRQARRRPTRRRWPPGSRTPSQPKVLHDAKGPMLALRRARDAAGRAGARHRAVGVPRPPRPALLRPGRPDRPLPQARAAAGAGRRRPAQPRGARRRRGSGPGPARPRCCTPARCSTWPRRSTTSSRSAAAPGCSPRSSCRWSTCSPRWSAPASPSTATTSSALEDHFAAEVKLAAEEAFAVIGKEINLGSPKQLQVVLFDELRDAEDQAHQDRLHDRRRRAAGALRQDRAPVPAAPAAAPRRVPAAADHRGAAQDGLAATAGSARRSTS